MQLNLAKELAELERMTASQLRERFGEVFGETTHNNSKPWLVKRIAWRLQANAEGGLSERARARAQELVNEADLRVTAPKRAALASAPGTPSPSASWPFPTDGRLPIPGTVLTRVYKGRTLRVTVLGEGFEFEGQVFKSLSGLAKHVSGCHYNGFLFFNLPASGATK